jgi:hypothetical protein
LATQAWRAGRVERPRDPFHPPGGASAVEPHLPHPVGRPRDPNLSSRLPPSRLRRGFENLVTSAPTSQDARARRLMAEGPSCERRLKAECLHPGPHPHKFPEPCTTAAQRGPAQDRAGRPAGGVPPMEQLRRVCGNNDRTAEVRTVLVQTVQ